MKGFPREVDSHALLLICWVRSRQHFRFESFASVRYRTVKVRFSTEGAGKDGEISNLRGVTYRSAQSGPASFAASKEYQQALRARYGSDLLGANMMSSGSAARLVANRLIGGLPRRELGRILRSSESADLVPGAVLCEPRQNTQHVYFPEAGFLSLAAAVSGHAPLEVGLIGSEGMLGATLLLGVDIAPLRAVVQGAGTALRMNATEFLRVLQDCHALRRVLNHYLYVMMAQFAQTTVCTRFHVVEKRLARWLLMTHDRAHADHFHLTHELLANMLGVRRSGITVAAGALQKRNLIGYSRGQITVLNREGLEAASCECYRADIATQALWLAAPEVEAPAPDAPVRHPTPFIVGSGAERGRMRTGTRVRPLVGDIASRPLTTRH